ncbi:hypothetical protein OF83DRAFT_1063406 [Amylostereum chailletii]|nr:hypothetical protein OF83DRAFT_1063406 [Amylostereum chailletii]
MTAFPDRSPYILAFGIAGSSPIIDHRLELTCEDRTVQYKLKGIVYYGQVHFTARVIDRNDDVWFHDGITTKESCVYEGRLDSEFDLNNAHRHTASLLIYRRC